MLVDLFIHLLIYLYVYSFFNLLSYCKQGEES